MGNRSKHLFLLTYGIIASLILGSITGGFYLLQGWLIELVWPGNTFRPIFNAVWLLLVGLLIFATQRTTGQLPKSLGRIRADLANTGRSSYRYVLLQMVVPAIMLTSGTSLGPEATLVSSTVLYGIWLSEKLRYLERHYQYILTAPRGERLRILLTPHRFLERRPAAEKGGFWTPQLVTFFLTGCLAFYLTCKWGGEPSVIIRIGTSVWQGRDLIWLLPLMAGAYLLGSIYRLLMVGLRKILLGRVTRTWGLLIVGGIAIYLVSLFFPKLMFSGMHNFVLLAGSWQGKSAGFLLLRSALKLALLTICLNTGWLGGDIFPVLFASTIQGIAISQFLPQVDPIFLIGVVAISMGSAILESPIVAGGVMIVFFLPLNLSGIGLLITGILLLLEHGRKNAQPHLQTFAKRIAMQLDV
jgi:H+/Cl- antiporter ClcA